MTHWLKITRGVLAASLAALILTGCSSSLPSGGGTGGQGAGSGGSGGQGTGTGGVVDAGGDGVCHNFFYGGRAEACCPDPAPDCSGEPDGYPGYACTSRTNPYCECACQGGKWICGC
jgi:hypothetical protein